jgi:hypothetical protein
VLYSGQLHACATNRSVPSSIKAAALLVPARHLKGFQLRIMGLLDQGNEEDGIQHNLL